MIDFQALKEAVGIEEVARNFLQMKVTEDGEQLRAQCPSCETEDPRSLVITPSKGLFYCFKAKKGGDLISLVSHCHGASPRESGEALAKFYMDEKCQVKKDNPQPKQDAEPSKGIDSVKYIKSLKRGQ